MSVRLLFDENTAPKLVAALTDLFPESQHVAEAGLASLPELQIWEFAKKNDFIIVTKDSLSRVQFGHGRPPQLIWIGLGNCSTRHIERALRGNAFRIAEFTHSEQISLLVIRRSGKAG